MEIGTGIAFPFGSAPAAVKAFETEDAVRRGCTAVDMVMNVGALKDRRYEVIREELRLFEAAAGPAVTKCILEVCYLTDEEIAAGCKLIAEAGIAVCQDLHRPVRRAQPGAVPGDAETLCRTPA